MKANKTQIGGQHYRKQPLEHWDIVAMMELDYYQGNITKYVMRWRDKGGIEDLKKARHYLDKYIELETAKQDGSLMRTLLKHAMEEVEEREAQRDIIEARKAQQMNDLLDAMRHERTLAGRCPECGGHAGAHADDCAEEQK